MKLVVALFVFILAMSLSFESTAESAKGGAGHGSGHGDLSAKMNSLFPEKQKNPAVGTPPRQTKLVAPKFLTTVPAGTVKLQWSETVGATNYHVQVATDPNFKWVLLNEHFAKGTSLDFATAETGKRYFWRVASVKNDNISMHSKSLFVSSAFDAK